MSDIFNSTGRSPIDRVTRDVRSSRSLIAAAAVVTFTMLLAACSSRGDASPASLGSDTNDTTDDTTNDTVVDSVDVTGPPPVTEPAPTTATATSTTAAPTPATTAPVSTASAVTAPQPVATTPPAAPPTTPGAAGAACLIGEWTISESSLAAYFDAVETNSGFESIDGVGVISLSFTATTYQWINDYRLAMVVGGVTYEGINTGGFRGTYSESRGVLTGSIDEEFRTGTVTRDGAPLTEDPGDLFVDINPARPLDALSYSCDGPSILLGAGPRVGAVHQVRLDPA